MCLTGRPSPSWFVAVKERSASVQAATVVVAGVALPLLLPVWEAEAVGVVGAVGAVLGVRDGVVVAGALVVPGAVVAVALVVAGRGVAPAPSFLPSVVQAVDVRSAATVAAPQA